MKFILLHPDDAELFDYDVNDKVTAEFLITNLSKFRKMYMEQGNTFWVRYLLTLHEFYLSHMFGTLLELLAPHFNTCVHYCLKAVENTLIRIHKRYIEGQYDSAKDLIKDIYRFAQISSDGPNHLIPFDPYFVKQNYKVIDLYGPCRKYDRAQNVKTYFIVLFYGQFYSSLCTLLKRYMSAPDLPENYDDNIPDKQYWMPFDSWLEQDYEPKRFEKYIAKCWSDKLPKMLLIPDIHNIFSHESRSHFCFLHDNDFDISDLKYSQSSHLRHRFCEIHKYCRKKILHNRDCKEPYFCLASNSCKIICDILSRERQSKLVNSHKDLWKHFDIVTEVCVKKKCRNVMVQVETFDSLVETYIIENIKDNSFRPPSPPSYLSPELKNIYYQYKRKEETVARLREKLGKKQIDNTKKKTIQQIGNINLTNFNNRDYCMQLYKRATRRFEVELDTDNFAKIFKCQILENLSSLPFKEIRDNLCSGTKNDGNSASSEISRKRSIGVGYDGFLGYKVLKAKKYINKKLEECVAVSQSSSSQKNIVSTINKCLPEMLAKDFSELEMVVEDFSESTWNMQDNRTLNSEIKLNQSTEVGCNRGITLNKKRSAEIPLVLKSETDTCKSNILKEVDEEVQLSLSTDLQHDNDIQEALKVVQSCVREVLQPSSKPSDNQSVVLTHITSLKDKLKPLENGYENSKTKISKSQKENKPKSVLPSGTSKECKHDSFNQQALKGAYAYESTTVSEKLDIIEKGICEKQGLGYEEFMLMLEAGNQLVGSNDSTEVKEMGGVKKKPPKNLHVCAYCSELESNYKFKKCAQCKAENFPEQRYYCSRECQTEDWKERHRDEHYKNLKL